MKSLHLTALTLAMALTACAVGPEYQAPVIDMPAHWHEMPEDQSTVLARADWWHAFNDATLDRLMEQAARNNLDIAHASAMLRASRAERGIVAASRFPRIEAGASATREHESANVPNTVLGQLGETDNLFRVGFDASWEIDLFGARQRSIEAATAELEAAGDDRQAVTLSVLAEVAHDYVAMRGAEAQIALAREDVAAATDALSLTRCRRALGLETDAATAAAEADVAMARARAEPFDATRKTMQHRLAVLLGQSPGEIDPPLGQGAAAIAPDRLPADLPSDLLRQRPDVRAAERRVAAATARVGMAQADWYPRFSLRGDVGSASSTLGSLADGASRTWSIGPTLSWPILRFGQLAATVSVRNAELQAALITYRRAILLALEDAEDALAAYRHERAQHAQLTTAVAAQRDRAVLAQSRFAAGLSDFRAVAAARRALIDAQQALSSSDIALATNWIALHKALGGGWSNVAAGALADEAEKCRAGEGGGTCIVSR